MSTVTITESTDLDAQTLEYIDRGVRYARKAGFCEDFARTAAHVFKVDRDLIRDSDGYDCRGWNREGFNQQGFDESGRNKEGYDELGFDRNGYDKEGYDRYGNNAQGVNREGRDKYRFNQDGWDQEGYGFRGQRASYDRNWYARLAAMDPSDFKYDTHWNVRPGSESTPDPDEDEDDDYDGDNDD